MNYFGRGGTIMADSHVLSLTETGELVLVKPDPNAYTEVARHLAWLGQYGEARISGSGACVFAAWPEVEGAAAALAALPADMKGWVAQGLDVHPLRQLAA